MKRYYTSVRDQTAKSQHLLDICIGIENFDTLFSCTTESIFAFEEFVSGSYFGQFSLLGVSKHSAFYF